MRKKSIRTHSGRHYCSKQCAPDGARRNQYDVDADDCPVDACAICGVDLTLDPLRALTPDEWREEAEAAADDDRLEIDTNARVTQSSDNGVWVQAWLYVRHPEATGTHPEQRNLIARRRKA